MKHTNQAIGSVPAAARIVLDVSGEQASAPIATVVQSAGDSRYLLASAVSAYMLTLLDDANASAAQTTLGISSFIKALLDDTDGGTALATLGITKSLSSSGYYRFPNGIIIQWGSESAASDATLFFPISFPTALGAWVVTPVGNNVAGALTTATIWDQGQAGGRIQKRFSTVGGGLGVAGFTSYWVAIGY